MESVDLAVIGAGWYGIATAKAYLELHPTANIVVLEAAETAGGTWGKGRLYPGLITNNMYGMLHFPDFTMDQETYGVKAGQHIPGPVVHDYLTAYAKKFGVYGRIRFQVRVDTVESRADDKWLLSTSGASQGTIIADRLVVATGLTSTPSMPKIAGIDTFGGPVLHAGEALFQAVTVKTASNVVILGTGKSAFDCAYAHASQGVTVDMIVHASGRGPIWMAPPYVTPLKKWIEKLVTTRFLTFFSPCTWGDDDGYGWFRSYLHGTAVGRFFVTKFWDTLTNDVIDLNGYNKHPEMKKLQPWHSAYYEGNQLSINNYPTNVFDLVREGKIRPHVADVLSLSPGTVHLSTGEDLKTDAVICATGWKHHPSVRFVGVSDKELGLPYASPEKEPLAAKADDAIFAKFPSLKTQPSIAHSNPDGLNHPYRLYRFLVPPKYYAKRNIAFAGATTHTVKAMIAPMQALWLSAYFDDKLDRTPASQADVEWQTMLHTQYLKWRHPLGHGARQPDFVFDALPYVDQLMADLGLNRWRKGSAVKEISEGYSSDDYRDVVDEWKEGHGWVGKT